jgi:hypothetical protein
MPLYARFDSLQKAQAVADYINSHQGFPIVGKCRGVDAPDKQQTVRWCGDPMECVDGKYAIPVPPDDFYTIRLKGQILDKEQMLALAAQNNVTIEEYDPAWVINT